MDSLGTDLQFEKTVLAVVLNNNVIGSRKWTSVERKLYFDRHGLQLTRMEVITWKLEKQARHVVADVLPLYWLPVFPTQTSSSFGEFVVFLLLPSSYEGDLVKYPSSMIEVVVSH